MDIEEKYIIYMHRNKINGKIYIGQSKRTWEERAQNNGSGYRKQIFYRAIEKYGWDNFEHIILESNLTKQEANDKEKYYIKLYKSNDKNFGYNRTLGGDGHTGTMPDSVKEKIHLSMLGEKNHFYNRHHTEETKQKIRNHMPDFTGKNNPFFGKKHTEETKKKISKTKQGQGNKKVICITTNEIFDSLAIAAKTYNICACDISKNCHKTRKSAGKHPVTNQKLVWCFFEEGDKYEKLSK